MPAPFDQLEPISFEAIRSFARDDFREALAVFLRSAAVIAKASPAQRPARTPSPALINACREALETPGNPRSNEGAREFFMTRFRPWRLKPKGFVTAYYEPAVAARTQRSPEFRAPLLARPADLVTLNDAPLQGGNGELLTSARRLSDGRLEPYPERRAIEADVSLAQSLAIAYVRDWVELFLLQVQGSARLVFLGGREARVTYDGRNGHPYASVGRALIENGYVAPDAMSLAKLKETLRTLGQEPGDAGRSLMQRNRSYVFFRVDDSSERRLGPLGGQGCALTARRSIAIDRALWSYGLPFWIDAMAPWQDESETRLARLMIAQDTGSAIIGPARADLFMGSGDQAGDLAGRVRHDADFIVLLPRGDEDG